MNFKTKLLAAATLLSTALSAQSYFFTTPGYKFNTSGATPVGSALYSGGTQGTYNLANGCYDENDNLLFYATNSGIYNASGSLVGNYGVTGYSNVWCSQCGGYVNAYYNQFASTEIEIVPVPGACKVYYVIYSMQIPPSLNKTGYIKVDCSSGSPVILYNGTITAPGNPPANAAWVFGPYSGGGGNICFAASNIISGSGSSAIRYLYVTSGIGNMAYYTISSSGIGSGVSMPFTVSGADYTASELELSPDGNWLAWNSISSPGNAVYIGKLNSTKTGFQSGAQWAATGNTYKGLEFSKPVGGVTYLYLAGSNGLSYVNTSTQAAPVAIATSPYDVTNTYLEMGKNGKIYGVSKTSTTQHLMGVDPNSSNALSATAVTFDSRYALSNGISSYPAVNNVYTLPEQIDGQDYHDFSGFPAASVSNININGVTGNCGFEQTYYNCQPITLNGTYVGTPAYYKIDVEYSNGDCDSYDGPGAMNYHGAWIAGAVPANIDVRNYTDANGLSLYNVPNIGTNNYKVTVWVKDGCGKLSWATSVFHLLSAVPPVINLEIYNTYYTNPSNTYLPASNNIASPILTGALTAGFRINNSTVGNATGYNIIIDKVDNTGATLQNIYSQSFSSSNISSVGPQQLNSFCVPAAAWSSYTGGPCTGGYTGYFAANNAALSLNNYYKLTVGISNVCSNVSASSFLYINNAFARTAAPTGIAGIDAGSISTSVYPNPASYKVTFGISSQVSDVYSISIYDVLGKKVATVAHNKALSIGDNSIEFNTGELANGVYTYSIEAGSFSKNGLLNISK